ncbi:MAG TPA: hypothetical protein VMC09_06630 [Anaerolineales bacterium]|nr:hypothetical protein [Anaerolineales bacterium]
MTTLNSDEKSSLVMAYTQNMLVRGEVVTKQNVKVSTWLRTQGVPEYVHFFKAQVLFFGSGGVKNLAYAEMFVPVADLIAFHLAPPAADPMDYAQDELNRVMIPVTALVGTFIFKGSLRISSKAGISASIELARSAWNSIYDIDVTNPFVPQMQAIHIPLVLVNPKHVSLAVETSS